MLENAQYKPIFDDLSIMEANLNISQRNLEELSQSACLITLDHLDVIDIDGEDAEKFLQGQFSNDLTKLKSGVAQLNTYCNPKGRTLAVFWLLREDNKFSMLLVALASLLSGRVCGVAEAIARLYATSVESSLITCVFSRDSLAACL